VQIQLDPGDTLVIYSDGVTDARDVQGKTFEMDGLLNSLRGKAGRPAKEIQDALLGDLSEFVGNAQPFDDITIITITRD
jgi:sigma-B regulation protein RsbU (phosphoserine phosphatase)